MQNQIGIKNLKNKFSMERTDDRDGEDNRGVHHMANVVILSNHQDFILGAFVK